MHQRAQHGHDVTIAASTTWPRPVARASTSAQATPKAAQRPGPIPEYRGRHDGRLPPVRRQRQQACQRDVVQVVAAAWASGPSWPQPVIRP